MTVDLAVSPGGRPADASPIGTSGGRKNWVDKAGGLPRYIRMIAHALIRKGMTPQHAIATAVNRVRKLAAGSTNPKVKAAAMAAVAEWEAKKAKAHLSLAYGDDPDAIVVDLATLEDADAMLLLDLAPGNYRPPYDWKHGYIPITPAAALSKAKGNKKRASKLLRGGARPSPRMAKQLEGARKSAPKTAPKLDQHGFPKRPSDPPEVELRRLNNYLAGRAGGTASDADVARWRKQKTELEAQVTKAQDDANRGRGVPGELAAAKKAVGPSDAEKIRNAATMHGAGSKQHLEAQRRFGQPVAVGATRIMQAEGVQAGDVWHAPGLGEKVNRYRIDKAYATKSDGSRNVDVTDLDTNTSKALSMQGDGKEHRIERSGKPDKSPVSSTGESVSAPKGASKSPSAGDGSPRLSGDTVRRMSDDQLDGALSRLMAAGGKDSHALALIEKEMDRRDKAKAGPQDSGIDRVRRLHAEGKAANESYLAAVKQHGYGHAETNAAGERVDRLASEADKAREGVKIPTPAKVSADMDKLKANGWRAATRGSFSTGGDEFHVVKAESPSGDSLQIVYGPSGQFKNAVHRGREIRSKKALDELIRGGSPKGDAPATGDTGLDDLTFKADRQSHKFTDDIVSRMSQPQLERSLGTLLSAGYDNDAPVVRKLTGALEAKDPEAAKVYRKGADRTAQDAKAALRFAHGTREQQKADYHAYVEHLAHQAEASDMVGAHALSRASRNGTVRLPDLWSMTPAQIRKHASPELLEWFSKPGNEPLPFDAWRAAHLGATDRRAVDSLRRRREQWLSEYG